GKGRDRDGLPPERRTPHSRHVSRAERNGTPPTTRASSDEQRRAPCRREQATPFVLREGSVRNETGSGDLLGVLASVRIRRRSARGGGVLALEVPEHGPRVHAEIAGGLRAVAVVALEHLEHVTALEVFLRLLERHDRRLLGVAETEILGAQQAATAAHQ